MIPRGCFVALMTDVFSGLSVGRGGEGTGGGVIMHGRNRMTIEPRIPTIPG